MTALVERRRTSDLVRWATIALSAVAALFFGGLGLFLLLGSLPAFRHSGWGMWLDREWFFRAELFGALPMLYATLVVAAVALLLAGPIGVGAACFTAEVLPRRARMAVKVVVELLAGVPSVVYGLLGVLLLRDWIYRLLTPWDPLSGDTLLTGGVLLAVMVLPTVMTFADDALAAVPASQRQAARGLGLSRAQTIWSVSLPQALPGLVSALLLALGRALGETIAVFLVVGRQDNQWPERLLSLAPLAEAGQTISSKLGGSETFIAWGDPLHWSALVGLALLLLLVSGSTTLVGSFWLARGTGSGRLRLPAGRRGG